MDLFRAYFTTARHNRLLQALVVVLVLGAAFIGFVTTKDPQIPFLARVIVAFLFALAWLVMFLALHFILGIVTVLTRNYQGVLGQHTLILADDGLIERTDFNDTLHRWKGFYGIRQTRRYIYLYSTQVLYHTVPKGSFASVSEMDSFLAEIRRRKDEAQRTA